MIAKQTWIHVSDNTNVRWLRTFHLYKGFHRRCTTVGFFVKGSARIVEPPRLEYKGFKFKFNNMSGVKALQVNLPQIKSFDEIELHLDNEVHTQSSKGEWLASVVRTRQASFHVMTPSSSSARNDLPWPARASGARSWRSTFRCRCLAPKAGS